MMVDVTTNASCQFLRSTMDPNLAQHIAHAFLPSRWHFYYTRSKLHTDPLYDGVCAALRDTHAPVLDLGCGIGLLAHCLRGLGLTQPYLGVDNDMGKIELAQQVMQRAQLHDVQFDTVNLAQHFPAHRGSVVLLDVLQYLPPTMQQACLEQACRCITPGARLVIRTGLSDPGWRSTVTRAADLAARAIRWMNTGPKQYPTREQLTAAFAQHGLRGQFQPLWGNTPFNNWLVVAALD